MRGLLPFLLLSATPALARVSVHVSDGGSGFGVGGGILTVYPPMAVVRASWSPGKLFDLGLEGGYFVMPLDQFSGTSTYYGLAGKFVLPGTTGLFAGLSAGHRSFVIKTKNNLDVNDVHNVIVWTRSVDQQIIYPKFGWLHGAGKSQQFSIAAGVVLPMSSSVATTHDPSDIGGGLPPERLAQEQDQREKDVTKVTNAVMPSIEFIYQVFFNAAK